MITDNSIIQSINNIKFKKTNSIFNRLTKEEQEYLLKRYNDSLSIKETIYRIKNNIEIRPVCKKCGNPVEFCRNGYFRDFCCSKCSATAEQTKEKLKVNSLQKYGYDHPSKSKNVKDKIKLAWSNKSEEELQTINEKHKKSLLTKTDEEKQFIQEKRKQTKLKRYGDEYYCNADKANKTKLKKYGGYFTEKYKETMLNKYGVEHPAQNKEIHEKIKKTNIEKYGVEYPAQSSVIKEKIINTNIKKYGVKYASQLEAIKEKQKKTCLEKYGVDTFFKTRKLKDLCHSEHTNYKRNKTNQNNLKCCKFSKEENKVYELIKEKFSNIIRQYTSKEYPFNCDFYIPEINTYIEYNGSHYHHYHPFNNENLDDIKELKRLQKLADKKIKENKKSQYSNIIYTWTDLDVRKRNTAKNNKLNFIEFWNIDEVQKWLSTH